MIFLGKTNVMTPEFTALLEKRLTQTTKALDLQEVGRVVSVGDGIARVYGLQHVQAGEMVDFVGGVKGMALNLENEHVGIVLF